MIHWKTVLASAKQKSKAACVFISPDAGKTIKTKMIAHFEMQHRDIMRLQLLQEQNQTKCFFPSFFHKWLLVLFTHTKKKKKRPSFSINEAGNWVRGPAGYGLTMMAWGPNLTLSRLHGGISHSRPRPPLPPPPPLTPLLPNHLLPLPLLPPAHPSIPHPKVSCFSADRY